MRPRSVVLFGWDACGHRHWAGEAHADTAAEAFGGCPNGPRHVVLGGGNACRHRHWDLRWSSLWGR
eukprot:9180641-Pyramimonas_sp.AAC.1